MYSEEWAFHILSRLSGLSQTSQVALALVFFYALQIGHYLLICLVKFPDQTNFTANPWPD